MRVLVRSRIKGEYRWRVDFFTDYAEGLEVQVRIE